MRRIIIISSLLAVFGGSAVALAATSDPNSYHGSALTVAPKKAGTARKPVPVGWVQTIKVQSNQANKNAAPLKDIKTTIYGFKVDTKLEPTCSSSTIESTRGTGCKAKSLVASGTVTSKLGPSNRNPNQSETCGPLKLNVYNGGKNFVNFFFIVPTPASCPGAMTGSAAPYRGTFSRSGKNLILDVPLPPDVSTNAANLGLYSALTYEHLVWKKITKKVKGKTVGYFGTVGCKAGKRPVKVKFTDTTNSTNRYSTTVSSKVAC